MTQTNPDDWLGSAWVMANHSLCGEGIYPRWGAKRPPNTHDPSIPKVGPNPLPKT